MTTNDISARLSNDSRPVFTIGVASELIGVSVHTLRMYENEGLIIPDRTDSQRRMYSRTDIERLRCIRTMIEDQGLNLAGIKALLSLTPCWEIKQCSQSDRENCDAYKHILAPCWSVKSKGNLCQTETCTACIVYQNLSSCDNMKTFLKKHWKNV